ncbi:MAG: hypothetical protein EBY23_07430, partial [Actinobacteria bacterium]|nr:hypothetical protein [Actinomycetota bacterium]
PLTPADTDEYHRWYSQQHLPDVLACPGFIRAQRFRISHVSLSTTPWATALECMNIYEHSCETVEEYNVHPLVLMAMHNHYGSSSL